MNSALVHSNQHMPRSRCRSIRVLGTCRWRFFSGANFSGRSFEVNGWEMMSRASKWGWREGQIASAKILEHWFCWITPINLFIPQVQYRTKNSSIINIHGGPSGCRTLFADIKLILSSATVKTSYSLRRLEWQRLLWQSATVTVLAIPDSLVLQACRMQWQTRGQWPHKLPSIGQWRINKWGRGPGSGWPSKANWPW